MALCLNPQCQNRIPANSKNCRYCGSDEISEFDSYSKAQAIEDEITMENFQKVVKRTDPFIERTILPKNEKASLTSKLLVRVQFLSRKLFRRKSR